MKSSHLLLASLVGALALPAVQAFAQANITTSPTAVIYVDAVNGSDSNSGTASLPLQTIGAAIKVVETNNDKSIGTDVKINPGTYREFVDVQANWEQTTAPMTIEAVTPGTAIIKGSDVLRGLTPYSGNTSIYEAAWNFTLTGCPVPSGWPSDLLPIALRTEMIFVNGTPLSQVMSLSQMRQGTFYINDSAHLVYIWPSSSVNMTTATVEASARRQTFKMNAISNAIVKGLVFEHGASCMNTHSVDVMGSNNIVLDDDEALWNNWAGLAVSDSNHITVENSTGSYNGGVGFVGTQNLNISYTDNETDYNNWRGAMGAFYDWGMGGTKFFTTQGATLTNLHSFRNQAEGLWFDTDHKNITVNTATLLENLMAGIQVEANPGPVTVNDSIVCSNGAGVNVLYSENLKLANNTFFNNSGTNHWESEIFIGGAPGGRTITDWVTNASYHLYSQDMTFTGNISQDNASGQFTFGTYMSLGTDWSKFTDSFTSYNNKFYDSTTTTSFKIPGVKYNDPTNLAGWQSLMGTDAGSSWVSTPSLTSTCVVPNPSYTDFAATTNLMDYTTPNGTGYVSIHIQSYGYGAVTLTTSPLPSGVTGSFSRNGIVSGVLTLTFTTSKTAATQTVPVTIFATSGARVHPTTISLSVTPAP